MVKVGFTLSCPYAFLPLNCLIGNANFTTLCLMSEPSKIVEYSVRTDNKAVQRETMTCEVSYLMCCFEFRVWPFLKLSTKNKEYVCSLLSNSYLWSDFHIFNFQLVSYEPIPEKRESLSFTAAINNFLAKFFGIILRSSVFVNVRQETERLYVIFVCIPSFHLFITLDNDLY